MKGFMKKRWHGLPVGLVTAALLVCLLAGSAFAAYNFLQADIEVEVQEAIYPSFGASDDLQPYMVPESGVLPDINVTSSGSTVTLTIKEEEGGDASEFLPGEELVLPLNLRNRSDADFTVVGSWWGGGGNVILEYTYETNISGDTYKATGSWGDLNTFTTTLGGHEGNFGSALVGAKVLFVKVKANKDAVPGTYSLTLRLSRE